MASVSFICGVPCRFAIRPLEGWITLGGGNTRFSCVLICARTTSCSMPSQALHHAVQDSISLNRPEPFVIRCSSGSRYDNHAGRLSSGLNYILGGHYRSTSVTLLGGKLETHHFVFTVSSFTIRQPLALETIQRRLVPSSITSRQPPYLPRDKDSPDGLVGEFDEGTPHQRDDRRVTVVGRRRHLKIFPLFSLSKGASC